MSEDFSPRPGNGYRISTQPKRFIHGIHAEVSDQGRNFWMEQNTDYQEVRPTLRQILRHLAWLAVPARLSGVRGRKFFQLHTSGAIVVGIADYCMAYPGFFGSVGMCARYYFEKIRHWKRSRGQVFDASESESETSGDYEFSPRPGR